MIEFFDAKVEKSLLANLLTNKDLLEQNVNIIKLEDFYVQNHKLIYEIIERFYRKYYKNITREILIKWLDKNDPKHKTEILTLHTELIATGDDSYTRYHINEIQSLTTKRKLYALYTEIREGLESDLDPNKLYTSLTRNILTTQPTNVVNNTSVFDQPDERIKEYFDKKMYPEKYVGIPYGIRELDEITGGMFKQQLYLVIGRTNAGKSRYLFNVGCNVAKMGKKVMYCTIEMDAKMIQHMWESRETAIPFKKIIRATLSEDEEKKYVDFLQTQKTTKHPFYIVDIPQGCTTALIESEIITFEKIHGQPPDVVLIDYANLIQPVSKYKDRAEKYDHVFRELHEGARFNNTVYYTAAQQNRESLKAQKVGTEHIAFSDATSYHCDSIFHIFADEKDEVNNDVSIEVIKGRYHEKGSALRLAWYREINKICSWHLSLSKTESTENVESKDVINQNGSGQIPSSEQSLLNENLEY